MVFGVREDHGRDGAVVRAWAQAHVPRVHEAVHAKLHEENQRRIKTRIKEICEAAGIDFRRLETLGFMRAPCSKGHHLNRAGGLAEHSKNVVEWILKLSPAFGVAWDSPRSPYVVGLLHDFVKLYNYDVL